MKTFFGFMGVLVAAIIVYTFGPLALWVAAGVQVYRGNLARYLKTVGVSIDQVGAALVYDVEDWTLSSVTHFYARDYLAARLFERFIDLLALPFEPEHCGESYRRELAEIRMNPREYMAHIRSGS